LESLQHFLLLSEEILRELLCWSKKIGRPITNVHKNSNFIYRYIHNCIQMLVPITCMEAA
jgi:hypothetical protein